MVTVKEISDYIEAFAPYSTQCEWDNCGLLIGDTNKSVKKVGFVLDLTREVLDEAEKEGVELIITHHPVIFKAQKNFLKGNIAFDAAALGISVLSAHTCFDCAEGGVNDILCKILNIKNPVGVPSADCTIPMARIGDIDEISVEAFACLLKEKLNTVCSVADCSKPIKRVAVCGGAGGDFITDAFKCGADAYVTGEMKHHEFLLAHELGISAFACGHFETENPAVAVMKNYICDKFKDLQGIILKQSNPVKYVY